MVRFRILLVATIASLSAIQGCDPVVQGVKQEETVLRFKMKSLAGEELELREIPDRPHRNGGRSVWSWYEAGCPGGGLDHREGTCHQTDSAMRSPLREAERKKIGLVQLEA